MTTATRTRAQTPTTSAKNAERDARLVEVHKRLDEAVSALVTGDDWIRAMRFAARFRTRSFNNTLLIWMQHVAAFEAGETTAPEPTYVAGFQQWKALGRHVSKGKRGYQILAPVTARFASANPKDPASWYRLAKGAKPAPGETARSRMVGSRVAYVWNVSATEGGPLPEQPRPQLLQGEAPAGLWDGLAAQATAHGYTQHTAAGAAEIRGANGLTHHGHKTVHVRTDMDDAARVKTLTHELAHVLQGTTRDDVDGLLTDAPRHRGIAEVEAESVALMVAAAHDLDTSGYTVPYVAGWATTTGTDPANVVRSTAERVRAMALQILDALDTNQAPTGTPEPPA
ncbi:ArdC family protein [Isoptericola sp. NPDC056578]|uniref:ArdC family protein n=1 Tax=Isoptericola sp. NPDC056578 TaxID=3345870 RepID=UPI0036A6083E